MMNCKQITGAGLQSVAEGEVASDLRDHGLPGIPPRDDRGHLCDPGHHGHHIIGAGDMELSDRGGMARGHDADSPCESLPVSADTGLGTHNHATCHGFPQGDLWWAWVEGVEVMPCHAAQ